MCPPPPNTRTSRHLPSAVQEAKRETPSSVHSRNIVPLGLEESSLWVTDTQSQKQPSPQNIPQLLSDSTPCEVLQCSLLDCG